MTKVRLKPKARCRGELWHPPQVKGSGDDGHVPHVHCELWQIGLDIGTLVVPTQQRRDREAVALIPLTELPPLFRQPDYSGTCQLMYVNRGIA